MADTASGVKVRLTLSFAPWFRPLLRAATLAAALRLVIVDVDRFAAWCCAHNAVRVRVEAAA